MMKKQLILKIILSVIYTNKSRYVFPLVEVYEEVM